MIVKDNKSDNTAEVEAYLIIETVINNIQTE